MGRLPAAPSAASRMSLMPATATAMMAAFSALVARPSGTNPSANLATSSAATPEKNPAMKPNSNPRSGNSTLSTSAWRSVLASVHAVVEHAGGLAGCRVDLEPADTLRSVNRDRLARDHNPHSRRQGGADPGSRVGGQVEGVELQLVGRREHDGADALLLGRREDGLRR